MGWILGDTPEKRKYNIGVLLNALLVLVGIAVIFLLSHVGSRLVWLIVTVVFVAFFLLVFAVRTFTAVQYFFYVFDSFRRILKKKGQKAANAVRGDQPGVDSRIIYMGVIERIPKRLREKYVITVTSHLLYTSGSVVIVEYSMGEQRIYMTCDFNERQVRVDYKGKTFACLQLNDGRLIEKIAEEMHGIWIRRHLEM